MISHRKEYSGNIIMILILRVTNSPKEKDGCVVGFAKLKLFAAGCEDGAPNVSPPEPAAAPELVVDVVVDVVTNGKPPAEKPPVGAG